jgi:hypothetical protein
MRNLPARLPDRALSRGVFLRFCLAVTASACSYTTSTHDEDHVVRSLTTKQRTDQLRFEANVKLESPTTVSVRVVRQSLCHVADEQTIARTVVTTRTPTEWSGPVAGIGVLTTGLGFVADYQIAKGQQDSDNKFTTGDAVYIHTVGAVLIGQYLLARIAAGESRSQSPEFKKTVERGDEPCDDQPAAGALVRLTNQRTQGFAEARTDSRGLATLEPRDSDSSLFQGWTCASDGCVAPEYAISVNDTKVGLTGLPNGLKGLQAAKEAAQADLEKHDRAIQAEQLKQASLRVQSIDRFRQRITVGDDTHCGMVVEVKKEIVKVQTGDGEKWFRTSQLYPPGEAPCRIFNHVYVDP